MGKNQGIMKRKKNDTTAAWVKNMSKVMTATMAVSSVVAMVPSEAGAVPIVTPLTTVGTIPTQYIADSATHEVSLPQYFYESDLNANVEYSVSYSTGMLTTGYFEGHISGESSADFAFDYSGGGTGSIPVTITASDGINSATSSFHIMVNPPIVYGASISSVTSATGDNLGIGSQITVDVYADSANYIANEVLINGHDATADMSFASGDHYFFTYTVSAGDQDQQAGQIPVQVELENPSGGAMSDNSAPILLTGDYTIDATPPQPADVTSITTADNQINQDKESSVTVNWTDSTSADIDHYEIIASTGALTTGVGENGIDYLTGAAVGTQTATFDYTSGDDINVGVIAVDTAGNRTLSTFSTLNASPEITVAADSFNAAPVLNMASSNVDVESPVQISFSLNDMDWANNITNIEDTSDGITRQLNPEGDYFIDHELNVITINPESLSVGDHTITIQSNGYQDSSIQFTVTSTWIVNNVLAYVKTDTVTGDDMITASANVSNTNESAGKVIVGFQLLDGSTPMDTQIPYYSGSLGNLFQAQFDLSGYENQNPNYHVKVFVLNYDGQEEGQFTGTSVAVPVDIALTPFFQLDVNDDGVLGVNDLILKMKSGSYDFNGDNHSDVQDIKTFLENITSMASDDIPR